MSALVQEEDDGVVHQRHRDVQAPLHAPGVAACHPVRGVGQAEALEQLLGALFQRWAAHPMNLALQAKVLATGGLHVDPGALGDHADRPAHAVGLGGDVDPGHGGAT
jgi:hypothetical protein